MILWDNMHKELIYSKEGQKLKKNGARAKLIYISGYYEYAMCSIYQRESGTQHA
jgi:hypothetical protein